MSPRKKRVPDPPVEEKTTRASPKVSGAQRFIESISKNQRYKGKVSVMTAGNMSSSHLLRRPTGVLGLDIALGGGLHSNGVTEIYGPESVGKTYTAFKAGGQVQNNYGEDSAIFIYSSEIRPDKGFARQAGLCIAYTDEEIDEYDSIRRSRGLPTFTKEERADLRKQIGDVVISVSRSADDGLSTVLDAVKSNVFQLVIIESLGSLLTKEQEVRDIGDLKVATKACLVTDLTQHLAPEFTNPDSDGKFNATTVLAIDQVRAKMGFTGRGPATKAAADICALKHCLLASIEISRGANLRESKEGPVIGKEVAWKLVKGKAGTHDGKKGKFNYYHVHKLEPVFWKDVHNFWVGGIDLNRETVEVGKAVGLLEVAGSWVSWKEDGETIIRVQGSEAFADKLLDEPELQQRFRDSCMAKSGVLSRYK